MAPELSKASWDVLRKSRKVVEVGTTPVQILCEKIRYNVYVMDLQSDVIEICYM